MTFEFRLPDVGEGLHEAEVVRWLVQAGDAIAEDQPMVEIQTDKATVELPSPVSGVVSRLHAREGETVKVGAILITVGGEPTPRPEPGGSESGPQRAKGRWAPATPSTRRLARELGVEINRLVGSGPAGRVTDEDIRRAAGSGLAEADRLAEAEPVLSRPQAEPAAHRAQPKSEVPRRADRPVPLRGIRGVIAKRMVIAKQTIPHAAVIEEADMGALAELKESLLAGQPNLKLSFLPFIVKAVTRALRQFPQINACVSADGSELIERGEVHIGIAAATDEGLMVPVIRDADQRSVSEIAGAIFDLAERSRSRRVRPEELVGSTFTISNIGAVGGLLSVPIINHPEVAILGVHRVKERPVGRNGQIVLRPMIYLTLAFDHRAIDGDVATRFLTRIVQYLEQPGRLLVELI